jgi:hypothetical protein
MGQAKGRACDRYRVTVNDVDSYAHRMLKSQHGTAGSTSDARTGWASAAPPPPDAAADDDDDVSGGSTRT